MKILSWIALILFLAFLAVAVFASNSTEDFTASAIIDFFVLLSTIVITAAITRHYARKSERADQVRLGRISARRVIDLFQETRSLKHRVDIFRTSDAVTREQFKQVAVSLTSIAGDVKLTLNDVKELAHLDYEEDELVINDLGEDWGRYPQDQIECPSCETPNNVNVRHHASASGVLICIECGHTQHVHRQVDGSLKLGGRPLHAREKSDTARQTSTELVTCNTSVGRISVSLKCPNPECGSPASFDNIPDDFRFICRTCFECYTRYRYILSTQSFYPIEKREPMKLTDGEVILNENSAHFNCTECGTRVPLNAARTNSREKRLVQCFKCGTARLVLPTLSVTGASLTSI
jgi:hypothetical protein